MEECPLILIEREDNAQPIPAWSYLTDFEAEHVVLCTSVGCMIYDGEHVNALAPNMGNQSTACRFPALSGFLHAA